MNLHDLRRTFPLLRWERAARTRAIEEAYERGIGIRAEDFEQQDQTLSYRIAATLYRRLVQEGVRNPAAQVAQRLGIPPGTARSWIHKARGMGFLGPARNRAAGEKSTPPEKESQQEGTSGGRSKGSTSRKSPRTRRGKS